jgi:hypothetical protein
MGLPKGALKEKGRQGVLEVGNSNRIVRLFVVAMTLDQILGNWYRFIKPAHRIKNLVIVNLLWYLILLLLFSLFGLQPLFSRLLFIGWCMGHWGGVY